MKKTLYTLSLVATIAFGNDTNTTQGITTQINQILGDMPVSKIEKSDIENIYKVYIPNGRLIYVEPKAKLIIIGEMFEPNGFSLTKRDTSEWQKELETKELAGLTPAYLTKDSLKIDFGTGSNRYQFVIFTDPECPYCIKAEKVFESHNVSLFVNFLPLDFHKNATPWSLDILSSKDPKKTAKEIKNKNYPKIDHTKEAKDQLAKMITLATELGITGTPKLYVIDTKEKKVVDVINGANIPKIEHYLELDKKKE